jgi:hypothetical protein
LLTLLLPANIAALTALFQHGVSFRVALLRALVAFGALLAAMTETASLFHATTMPVLASAWSASFAIVIGLRVAARSPYRPLTMPPLPPPCELAALASIAAILAGVGYTALLSPPNSADAMSYHLPRVLFWIQQRSVEFFPTSYLNLIAQPPLAEYATLHLYLLSGGDHYTNLVQFAAFAGAIAAVSAVAQQCGLAMRAQVIAALFCATLPNVILQASGAKNDCVLALWIVCALLFCLRWLESASRADLIFLSLAAGLAIATKATAYLHRRRSPPHRRPALLAQLRPERLGARLRLRPRRRRFPLAQPASRLEARGVERVTQPLGATGKPQRSLEPGGVRGCARRS